VKLERILDGEARGAEAPEVVEKHRNMDVCPPFAGARICFPCRECIFEVEEAVHPAFLLFHRLSEVDRFGILRENVHDIRRDGGHVECCSFLKLEYRNPGINQLLKRFGDVLVRHGLMANVEYGSEMPAQGGMCLGDWNAG
jgi:hypothetical protein